MTGWRDVIARNNVTLLFDWMRISKKGGAEKRIVIEEYGILKNEPQMNADERGLIALLSEN